MASLLLFAILIFLLLITFSVLLFLKYRKKRIGHTLEKQKIVYQFNEQLLRAQLEIQEQTFKQIAQELHDNVGQMLTLVNLNLNTLLLSDPENEKLENTKSFVTKVIQDLRNLSRSLNSDTICKTGIKKAVETELQVIEKITGLKMDFTTDDETINMDSQVELILFRIVQEALHNTIKHAKAKSIQVSILHNNGHLLLVVKDDGVGFDSDMLSVSGSGLDNMKDRCRLINASFNMLSQHGNGTEIVITIPIIS